MKETWWQTCRVGRGSRLIAIWRRLEAVALATAMISSFAFVPLCAYANETGSEVVSGGGVITYTNAAAAGYACPAVMTPKTFIENTQLEDGHV